MHANDRWMQLQRGSVVGRRRREGDAVCEGIRHQFISFERWRQASPAEAVTSLLARNQQPVTEAHARLQLHQKQVSIRTWNGIRVQVTDRDSRVQVQRSHRQEASLLRRRGSSSGVCSNCSRQVTAGDDGCNHSKHLSGSLMAQQLELSSRSDWHPFLDS